MALDEGQGAKDGRTDEGEWGVRVGGRRKDQGALTSSVDQKERRIERGRERERVEGEREREWRERERESGGRSCL